MRGHADILQTLGDAPGRDRATSARAERTPSPRTAPTGPTGYLRSRGEDEEQGGAVWPPAGVPPLARRGPAQIAHHREHRRGTSARAERTAHGLLVHPQPAGYLRSRGEDPVRMTGARWNSGVPPLARRGPPAPLRALLLDRGTSARAERTGRPTGRPPASTGYLRSRGEDPRRRSRAGWPDGVPPLARRGLNPAASSRERRRGTSARAERTP